MVRVILIILIILWALGLVQIPNLPILNYSLITLLNRSITLYDILVVALMIWIIDLLPRPFRQLAILVLVLWLLSFFGILAIGGIQQILVLALIIGLVIYLIRGGK